MNRFLLYKPLEDNKDDAQAIYQSLIVKDQKKKENDRIEKEREAREVERARLLKETAEIEARNMSIFYQRLDETDERDAKEYEKYEEERKREKKEKENMVIQENIKLYNLRLELSKVWTKEQENKYYKLSRDKRIGFLGKTVEEILTLL